ncbi:MAG: histidine phosphatase family protein [Actinomycetota bacterium]|nr:histidine phosphatase family protein [Actinomycetota bacterium]
MTAAVRVLLVRHATTSQTRRACFPATTGSRTVDGCEALDATGLRQAAELGAHLAADRCWSSRALRALQTAECAGLQPEPLADLAEADFGAWAGRTLAQVHAADPDGLAAWYADPGADPHGGEPLAQVRRRAVGVLGRARRLGGTTVAVTHGGLIKAALLEALGMGPDAVWRLEVAPASVTELHPASDEGWRLVRLNWTPQLTRRSGGSVHAGEGRRAREDLTGRAGRPGSERAAGREPGEVAG